MAQALVRLAGILMMLTALVVGLTQVPDRPVDSLVARWALPPSDFMYVKGQFVHFRDEGPRSDPTPLVLLHGTAASLHTWEGWAAALRARKRVITFDLPGFGLTGPFAGQYPADDYRADTLARFTLDFLDALHVQRVDIGGDSLGGEVAWRLAGLAPQRVDRLVLVDASGYPSDPQRLPPGLRLAGLPVLGHAAEYLTPRPLVEASVKALYADPRRVTAERIDRAYDLLLREGNRRALVIRLGQAGTDRAPERIRALRVPTLIVWGAQDRVLPPTDAQRFAHDIAGSQLAILPGLGHVPQEEDPQASVRPVRAFLQLDDPTSASAPAR